MRIFYLAAGIPVPGNLGGSTHAFEVARGLAARGHRVDLIAAAHEGFGGLRALARPDSSCYAGFHLHQMTLPKAASLIAFPLLLRLAHACQPSVIMERYYNFAGTGLLVAKRLGLPALLEVNALIVDPPSVRKRQLDDALGGPMRRWAEAQCRMADAIVTPLQTTVPASIARAKIVELPWGADVARFREVAAARVQQPLPAVPTLAFMGSFRAWHGVESFVRAALAVLDSGVAARFILIGDGPARAKAEALAASAGTAFEFCGALAYEAIPAALARADVGVAPFETAAHPALQAAGFFWSPLKIFEYMAAGLPVITPAIAPLNEIVRHGEEGLLYREGAIDQLAAAMIALINDPQRARAMGQRGQQRAEAHYSWASHCAELEAILQRIGG